MRPGASDGEERARGTRRSSAARFKADAVRLRQTGDRSVHQVAVDLDLTESVLRRCIEKAEVSDGSRPADTVTSDEREELLELRERGKRLGTELEIPRKATVLFAKESG